MSRFTPWSNPARGRYTVPCAVCGCWYNQDDDCCVEPVYEEVDEDYTQDDIDADIAEHEREMEQENV